MQAQTRDEVPSPARQLHRESRLIRGGRQGRVRSPIQCPSPCAPSPGGLLPPTTTPAMHLLSSPNSAAGVSPGSWWDTQTPGPHPRPATSESAPSPGDPRGPETLLGLP